MPIETSKDLLQFAETTNFTGKLRSEQQVAIEVSIIEEKMPI